MKRVGDMFAGGIATKATHVVMATAKSNGHETVIT